MEQIELNKMNLADLKNLAKEHGVKITGLDKSGIIKKLSEYFQSQTHDGNIEEESVEEDIEKKIEENQEKSISELMPDDEENDETEIEENEEAEEVIESNVSEEQKIDFSEESDFSDLNDLVKENQKSNKTSVVESTNEDEDLTDEQVVYESDEIEEEDVDFDPKKSYSPYIIATEIISQIPETEKLKVGSKHNLKDSDFIKILQDEFSSGKKSYTEDKRNQIVKIYVESFEEEIDRIMKVNSAKKPEITLLHKKWIDYLKLYKITPEDMLKRYPNHPQRHIFRELVNIDKNKEQS